MDPSPSAGPRWRTVLWGTLVAAIAMVLLGRAVDAHGRNVGFHRQAIQEEVELERITLEQARLKQELRALNEDPVYVENVLRWVKSEAGKKETAP